MFLEQLYRGQVADLGTDREQGYSPRTTTPNALMIHSRHELTIRKCYSVTRVLRELHMANSRVPVFGRVFSGSTPFLVIALRSLLSTERQQYTSDL